MVKETRMRGYRRWGDTSKNEDFFSVLGLRESQRCDSEILFFLVRPSAKAWEREHVCLISEDKRCTAMHGEKMCNIRIKEDKGESRLKIPLPTFASFQMIWSQSCHLFCHKVN